MRRRLDHPFFRREGGLTTPFQEGNRAERDGFGCSTHDARHPAIDTAPFRAPAAAQLFNRDIDLARGAKPDEMIGASPSHRAPRDFPIRRPSADTFPRKGGRMAPIQSYSSDFQRELKPARFAGDLRDWALRREDRKAPAAALEQAARTEGFSFPQRAFAVHMASILNACLLYAAFALQSRRASAIGFGNDAPSGAVDDGSRYRGRRRPPRTAFEAGTRPN